MHASFYHWHARTELKPAPSVLEPRWDAAAKFARTLDATTVQSILNLALFSKCEPAFAKDFTASLLKDEPTFPEAENVELLRVMATAAIYSKLEEHSYIGDALALGIRASLFNPDRLTLITTEIISKAHDYLAAKAERIRPKDFSSAIGRSEKNIEQQIALLKKASDTGDVAKLGEPTLAVARGIHSSVKESHQAMSQAFIRITEESQFLWWLIGKRSSILQKNRAKLNAESYALFAATEAADRVALIPAACSTEDLIESVMEQCDPSSAEKIEIMAAIQNALATNPLKPSPISISSSLAPINALIGQNISGGDLDQVLKQSLITKDFACAPSELAKQYFREIIFIRGLQDLMK